MLEVRLLGQFEVQYGNNCIELPTRPAQSLLAYFILNTGITHRRGRLAGMLWPDSSESNARSYLRHALWRIRKSLEQGGLAWQDYLEVDDISAGFKKQAEYWLDCDQILKSAAPVDGSVADLMDAVCVYAGELLPGFYEEWVVLERVRLQAAFDHKMHTLLDVLVKEGRWDAILDWGERWIALGHVPEPAYRALMLAHASRGDLASAAGVYHRCVDALSSELGIAPSSELENIYAQISRGETPAEVIGLPTLVQSLTSEAPPAPGEAPFKGLAYFDVSDAHLFFGREQLTARLVGHLRAGERLLAVVGASGSGKSSLVRAGLVTSLRSGEALIDGTRPPDDSSKWPAHVITPGAHPLEALAALISREGAMDADRATLRAGLLRDSHSLHHFARHLCQRHDSPGLLLVVDQFEEVFTLCRDEEERSAFIDNLIAASAPELHGPTRVVIGLRADFYAQCSEYPALREALGKHQEYIGPMSAEELRRAIEEPARRTGWEFHLGLVDLILRDVRGEPGALPLLSHALLETWRRRSGRTFTLKGYAESGGVRGATARTAESVYNRRLNANQQALARGIFLRLTELGEGVQDTRRQATLGELLALGEAPQEVEEVLGILAQVRLITLGEGKVEVAHEALIREWPTLRGWLAQDRESLMVHRHLTEAAQEWEAMGRDEGELYQGARLEQAREWMGEHSQELNMLERHFLEASQALADQREAEREAQRQRELQAAKQLAQAQKARAEQRERANRQLRWFAIGLSVIVLITLVTAGFAIQQRNRAEDEAHLAKSRELASAAVSNLDVDPQLSVLLALEAVEEMAGFGLAVPREAQEALHRAVQASRLERVLTGHQDIIYGVEYSPNGTRIASGSQDGTARVWDAVSGEQLLVLEGHDGPTKGLSFSPDGRVLATAGNDRMVRLWDLTSGEQIRQLSGHSSWVEQVVFSPDGGRIAAGSASGEAIIWDVANGEVVQTLKGHSDFVLSLAFSPDGTRLVTTSADGRAILWDVDRGEQAAALTGHDGWVVNADFRADGWRLVTCGQDGTARVWDAESWELLFTLAGHRDVVMGCKFSPDGERLATNSWDRTARVWDLASKEPVFTLAGHTGKATGMDFSPDGKNLATGSEEGLVRIWNVSLQRELLTIPVAGGATDLSFSPNGKLIAAGIKTGGRVGVWELGSGEQVLGLSASGLGVACRDPSFSPDAAQLAAGCTDNTARVWNLTSGKQALVLAEHDGQVHATAYSPDGAHLATGSFDLLVRLWDAHSGELVRKLQGASDYVYSLVFSPDGSQLAAGDMTGAVWVWDLNTPDEAMSLSAFGGTLFDVAFHPDGEHVAAASVDGIARMWNLADRKNFLALQGHTAAVRGVDFSPDGELVATASRDGALKIWDFTVGNVLMSFSTDTGAGLTDVAFSPDGKLLASSGDDAIRVYAVAVNDLVALAQTRLARGFTAAECRQYLSPERCPPAVDAAVDREATGPASSAGKICLPTPVGGMLGTSGYSVLIHQGTVQVAEEFGWQLEIFEPEFAEDVERGVEGFLDAGCELIVAPGYSFVASTQAAAREYPEQRFLLLDSPLEPPLKNVWSEVYGTDQAAFLAGYAAASITRTGRVATFGAFPVPPVLGFMVGFEQGVDYYNQENAAQVEVMGWDSQADEGIFVLDYLPEELGYETAMELLSQGADVILPVAGPFIATGTARAALEHGDVYVIGVDEDMKLTAPEYADVILTSVEKRLDVSVMRAAQAIVNGNFSGGTHVGNLENGGVALSPFYDLQYLISEEVQADLQVIKEGIIMGEIKTKP